MVRILGAHPNGSSFHDRHGSAADPLLGIKNWLTWTFSDGAATFPGARLRSMMLEIVRTHWGMGTRTLPELYRPGISDEAARHLMKMFRDSTSTPSRTRSLRASGAIPAGVRPAASR